MVEPLKKLKLPDNPDEKPFEEGKLLKYKMEID